MQRLIVTGANGAGKSYLAAQLAAARPDVPLVSFDAIKLTRNWKQRPKPEINAELLRVIQTDNWILEGPQFASLRYRARRGCHLVRSSGMVAGLAAVDEAIAQYRPNAP